MLSQAGVMKELVAELVSLVGGSAASQEDVPEAGSRNPENAIPTKHRAPDTSAGKREVASTPKKEVTPEQVIPMNDQEFTDF
jgi:hypothetical protein